MRWNAEVVTWAALALLLFAAETMVPGAFLLWFGIAAAVVFAIVLVFDLPVLAQVALFAVLSFIAIQVYRRWFRSHEKPTDQPALNRRAHALVGRVVPLERAIVNGAGRVQIADAYWEVHGPDLPAGTPVRIVAVDGMDLRVESV